MLSFLKVTQRSGSSLVRLLSDLSTSFLELQLFQTVQAQAHFQLLLPPEKTCSSDYSGLLQAFQIFILDELKARGLCHLQVI